VIDVIVAQQRFIENMRGRTTSFSTFSDATFDETAFEAQLTEDRMATMVDWYWILKLQARFISGDYEAAMAAARKPRRCSGLRTLTSSCFDYYYYAALTVAALYENASADDRTGWRDLLTTHQEQLREWADTHPPTFDDKYAWCRPRSPAWKGGVRCHALVRAGHSIGARAWVRTERGLAYEVAARFYEARGFETFANAYLCNARSCYLRWGAHGKVRQLDRLYPHLAVAEGHGPRATIGSIQQLDVASIVKASQALSSEIELPKLIERLMTIAIENGGADRGLLILPAEHDHLIQAEQRRRRSGGSRAGSKNQSRGSPVPIPSSVMSSARTKA